MEELWNILRSTLLLMQFLAALVGCLYYNNVKRSYWKWFTVYLTVLFISEFVRAYFLNVSIDVIHQYYLFIVLPLEFIFLYWLYAQQSLKNKKLFLLFSILLIGTTFFTSFMENLRDAISLNTNVGSLLLIILVVQEYLKQIKNDDILKFKENKMFYINLGVVLFYVGSFPFHVFQKYLHADYQTITECYYVYFLVANCIMYLLFAASFIWGKEQS